MTTLTDLKRLALAAIDALERTRRGELDQMALLDARSVEYNNHNDDSAIDAAKEKS